MLWAPASRSRSIISASRSSVTRAVAGGVPWLIWWFWQKPQPRAQPKKKIVPEPRVPEIGGSSPVCSSAELTYAASVAPQAPVSPCSRRAPHARGHSRQGSDNSASTAARRRSSPVSWRRR
jgi:hypothetical protein